MYGGFGNDFYVIDNSGDIADETDGDGSDTILSYDQLQSHGWATCDWDLGQPSRHCRRTRRGIGCDTIPSAISFSLADPVRAIGAIENLTLTGTSNINATGNALNNELTGNSGANDLIGGAMIWTGVGAADTASYAASTSGVTVSLMTGSGSGGDAQGDTLTNIENLTGSNFDDTLEGNAGNNKLVGGLGTDTVSYANATSGRMVGGSRSISP